VNGYVPQLFERLVAGVGIEGLRGLGDCLIGQQSQGLCPDGSDYLGTLDSGGACLPSGSQGPLAPGQTYCPGGGTSVNPCGSGYKLDPTGGACIPLAAPQSITVTASAGGGGCPVGFVLHPAGIAVCIPANSPAALQTSTAAKPDWTKYALWGGGGLLLLVMVAMVAKR